MIFAYPNSDAQRRHGPEGYTSYESFRPWLRDEFTFRCVYCLKRETWGQVTAEFELDHFQPQAVAPTRTVDYFNLVYSCRRCNAVKQDQLIDDPQALLTEKLVSFSVDGSIVGDNDKVCRLIRQLDLNSPMLQKWRVRWMRIVQLAEERDPSLYSQLVGFPDDLPNLGHLRPPSNSRAEGIEQSWYTRKQHGLLPKAY
ncbi:MAG TPA: HNH endonuclease domain-containing protein [Planctomycetaceae bacterium]|nr:HNH endonuclease domain-containing protein [Planctomycetaceae bacterium]